MRMPEEYTHNSRAKLSLLYRVLVRKADCIVLPANVVVHPPLVFFRKKEKPVWHAQLVSGPNDLKTKEPGDLNKQATRRSGF